MSRALQLTQKQITALCKGAERAGFVPIVQIGEVFVRLVPEEHAVPADPEKTVAKKPEIDL